MAKEYDLQTALDISSLTSVTQAQLMQMFSRLKPLANKGLIFVGTIRPNITQNPHYIRYIWMDITVPSNPVFKRYVADRTSLVDADASWEAEVAANGSILTAMFAAASPTGGINVALLKRAADGLADATKRFFIIRLDTNGQFAEAVDLDTALADISGGIDLAALDANGIGAGKYLGVVAGALSYRYLDPTIDLTQALNNRVPATSIKPEGGSFFILRVNAANDACEFVAPADINEAGDITLDKLGDDIDGNSPAAYQVPQSNGAGTKVLWTLPILSREYGPVVASAANLTGVFPPVNGNPPAATEEAVYEFAHALGSLPKMVSVRLICTVDDSAVTGYVVNDEIDAAGLHQIGTTFRPGASWMVTSTALRVMFNGGDTGIHTYHKTTGVTVLITPTSWKLKVYAAR